MVSARSCSFCRVVALASSWLIWGTEPGLICLLRRLSLAQGFQGSLVLRDADGIDVTLSDLAASCPAARQVGHATRLALHHELGGFTAALPKKLPTTFISIAVTSGLGAL